MQRDAYATNSRLRGSANRVSPHFAIALYTYKSQWDLPSLPSLTLTRLFLLFFPSYPFLVSRLIDIVRIEMPEVKHTRKTEWNSFLQRHIWLPLEHYSAVRLIWSKRFHYYWMKKIHFGKYAKEKMTTNLRANILRLKL